MMTAVVVVVVVDPKHDDDTNTLDRGVRTAMDPSLSKLAMYRS
jgi:hypothetical protein